MIVRELYNIRDDGINLYITYSDNNKMIIQNETGHVYQHAIDVADNSYTYSESAEEIPVEEGDANGQ